MSPDESMQCVVLNAVRQKVHVKKYLEARKPFVLTAAPLTDIAARAASIRTVNTKESCRDRAVFALQNVDHCFAIPF